MRSHSSPFSPPRPCLVSSGTLPTSAHHRPSPARLLTLCSLEFSARDEWGLHPGVGRFGSSSVPSLVWETQPHKESVGPRSHPPLFF